MSLLAVWCEVENSLSQFIKCLMRSISKKYLMVARGNFLLVCVHCKLWDPRCCGCWRLQDPKHSCGL